MAVAFDASSQIYQSAGGALNSSLLTVGSGTNRALLVILTANTNCSFTAPTWGGVTMTALGAAFWDPNSSNCSQFFGLLNPASGKLTLTANASGGAAYEASCTSWTGVDQTSVASSFYNLTTGTGNPAGAGTVSFTASSASGDMVVVEWVNYGASATSGTNLYLNGGSGGISEAYSPGAASVTLSCTLTYTGTQYWSAQAVSIKQVTLPGVNLDSTFSATASLSGKGLSITSFTVGTNANRALLLAFDVADGSATNYQTTLGAITWAGQALTFINQAKNSTVNRTTMLYGLLSPTSGNQTLSIAGNPSTGFFYTIALISFYGVNQTSIAAAFPNFNSASNTTGSATASVTVTSAANDMPVAVHSSSTVAVSSVSNSQWFNNTTGDFCAGNSATGAASVVMSANLTGSSRWQSIGVDVANLSTQWQGGAALAGASSLTGALAQLQVAVMTALAGTGALTAPAQQLLTSQSTLVGNGALTAAAVQQLVTQAVFAGVGAATTPAASLLMPTQTILGGLGGLVAAPPQQRLTAATAWAGAGSFFADSAVAIGLHSYGPTVSFYTLPGADAATTNPSGYTAVSNELVGISLIAVVQGSFQYLDSVLPVPAGAGALTASTRLLLAAQTGLAGAGAATAAPVQQLASQANFAGAGSATTPAAVLRLAAQSTLAGAGSAAAPPANMLMPAQIALGGSGTLAATPAQLQLTAQSALAGLGTSTSPAASLLMPAQTALAGAGLLGADATQLVAFTQWQGSAGLAGAGFVPWVTNDPTAMLFAASANLAGAGALSVGPLLKILGATGLAGAGALVASTANLQQAAQAGLAGAGALSAGALSQALASANFGGLGSLGAPAANLALTAAAGWAGAGSLPPSPAWLLLIATPTALAGAGSLTSPIGQLLLPAVPNNLIGAGLLQSPATRQLLATTVLASGTGNLNFTPNQWMTVTSPLAGSGYLGADLVKTGMQTLQASAAGLGALTAAPWQVMQLVTTWPGAGALAAQPQLQLQAVVTTWPGAGAIAAVPAYQVLAGLPATWPGTGSIAASSAVQMVAGSLWAGAGSTQAAASQNVSGASLWAGSGGLGADLSKIGQQTASAGLAGLGAFQGAVTHDLAAGTLWGGAGLLGADAVRQVGGVTQTISSIPTWLGAGALSAPAATLLLGAGTTSLAGAGALASPAARQLLSPSAALAGAGALGADLAKIGMQLAAAGLAGLGALAPATTTQVMAAQAGWLGAGSLGADLSKIGAQFGSAGLGGLGSLATALAQVMQSQVAWAGLGALSAASAQTMQSQASLAGAGSLGAYLGSIGQQFAAASLSGLGNLTAASIQAMRGQAAFAGAGALSAATWQNLRASTTWAGVGSLGVDLTSIGQQTAAAFLTGAGNLSGAAALALAATAARWTGAGAVVSPAASLNLSAQAQTWSGQGLMGVPAASLMGSLGASLAGAGRLIESTVLIPGGSQLWMATGSLTASAVLRMPIRMTLAGAGTWSNPAAQLWLNPSARWGGAGQVGGLVNAIFMPSATLQGSGRVGAYLRTDYPAMSQLNGAGNLFAVGALHSIRTGYVIGQASLKPQQLQGQRPSNDMVIGQQGANHLTITGTTPQPVNIVEH